MEDKLNKIIVKKFHKDLPNLEMLEKGDFIDLYVDTALVCSNDKNTIGKTQDIRSLGRIPVDTVTYKAGDVVIIGLGVAIELPDNCEAQLRPRSSTFKNTGLLLTNSVGTIDSSFKGDNDEWQAMFYATRDGFFKRFDRLVQFKVEEKMQKPNVVYVETLNNKDRGGYGTSGN